jgi:hypothetical protein
MKPVAYLHILDNSEGVEGNTPVKKLTFTEESPFGIPGKDHSAEFKVRSIPLYSIYSQEDQLSGNLQAMGGLGPKT